jgi:hypothetical protein
VLSAVFSVASLFFVLFRLSCFVIFSYYNISSISAWLDNREQFSKVKIPVAIHKGRKTCPSCKSLVRSNTVVCKKCKHSFAEIQLDKKTQSSIVWPKELQRSHSSSSNSGSHHHKKKKKNNNASHTSSATSQKRNAIKRSRTTDTTVVVSDIAEHSAELEQKKKKKPKKEVIKKQLSVNQNTSLATTLRLGSKNGNGSRFPTVQFALAQESAMHYAISAVNSAVAVEANKLQASSPIVIAYPTDTPTLLSADDLGVSWVLWE